MEDSERGREQGKEVWGNVGRDQVYAQILGYLRRAEGSVARARPNVPSLNPNFILHDHHYLAGAIPPLPTLCLHGCEETAIAKDALRCPS